MGTLHQKVRGRTADASKGLRRQASREPSPGRAATEVACASVGPATAMA